MNVKTHLETISYSYGDYYWQDKLTHYNGKAITYDNIGNPLSYDGQTFTWLGRRMTSYKKESTTTSYKYNWDGIRTTKTVGNTTTTKYFLDGSTILAQQTGSNTMPFYYDANGKRIAFKYNGEMYFYVYNLQGDVTHIMKGDKTIVGTYTYDAWGKITNLNSLTSIAQINPFRYRGYYYDSESNLYYVGSRYYNPDWGRFINVDTTDVLSASPLAITDKNLYAYCDNNPISREDASGNIWVTIGAMAVGGLIGTAISAISSAVTQQVLTGAINWKSVGVAAATGFISGAVAASPLGIAGQMVAGGVLGGLSYAADCAVNKTEIKVDDAFLSVGMGVLSGYIGGSGANNKMALSNTVKSAKKNIAREMRRANQKYSKKAIASTVMYCKNTFAMTAWNSSVRFATGCGVANGVTVAFSKYGFVSDVRTWKYRYR